MQNNEIRLLSHTQKLSGDDASFFPSVATLRQATWYTVQVAAQLKGDLENSR
jgi:hypothetical protein